MRRAFWFTIFLFIQKVGFYYCCCCCCFWGGGGRIQFKLPEVILPPRQYISQLFRNSFATPPELFRYSWHSVAKALRTLLRAADATRNGGERHHEFASIGRLIKPRVYIRI